MPEIEIDDTPYPEETPPRRQPPRFELTPTTIYPSDDEAREITGPHTIIPKPMTEEETEALGD